MSSDFDFSPARPSRTTVVYAGVSRYWNTQSLQVPRGFVLSEAEWRAAQRSGVPVISESGGALMSLEPPAHLRPGEGEIYCFPAGGGAVMVLAGWRQEDEAINWQPPRDLPFLMPGDEHLHTAPPSFEEKPLQPQHTDPPIPPRSSNPFTLPPSTKKRTR